ALDAGAVPAQPAHLPRRGGAGAVQRAAHRARGVAGRPGRRRARGGRAHGGDQDDAPQHLSVTGRGYRRRVDLTESDVRALHNLTLSDDATLAQWFDRGTVERGTDYARRGMVQRLHVDPDERA